MIIFALNVDLNTRQFIVLLMYDTSFKLKKSAYLTKIHIRVRLRKAGLRLFLKVNVIARPKNMYKIYEDWINCGGSSVF